VLIDSRGLLLHGPSGGTLAAHEGGFLARDMPVLDDHLHYRMVNAHSVLTLLSALCLRNEQTHKKLSRSKEGDTQLAGAVESLRTEQYDSSFAYRFCLRLRNFVLHNDVEVFNVNVTSPRLDDHDVLHGETTATLSVDRDRLIRPEEKGSWSTVRAEIEQLDARIVLNDLLEEAVTAARKMGARARRLLFPGNRSCDSDTPKVEHSPQLLEPHSSPLS
jgi:hypothetical protein